MLVDKKSGDMFRRMIVIAVFALGLTAAAALSQNDQPVADTVAVDAGQETVAVVASAAQAVEPIFIADSESVRQANTSAVSDEAAEIAESVKAEEGTVTQTIQSISFKKDMTVRDALRFLAAKYQKNIIPSAKVDGQVTVTSLYNVTFQEALNSILGYQFKYDEEGNFIKVYTAEEYLKIKQDKARMIYRDFELYYVSGKEMAKLVAPILSADGQIQASTPAEIGVALGDTVGGQPGGDTIATHDMLIVYDYPENIEKIDILIKKLDIKPFQVLVEATILKAKLTEDTKLGVDFSTLNGVAITGIAGIAAGNGGAATTTFGTTSAGAVRSGLNVGVSRGNVAALINALETITDTTVIANPKILAVNKQVGSVFIGQKLGYREGNVVSDGGVVTEGAVKFLDTGTKLSFRPYISGDGYIRMDIYPKESSAELNADGVPTETTAETATNIMIRDGETIVIGGLFRDSKVTTRSQIPFLGDIPFIGVLFRGTDDNSGRDEIIVLLTCHIIEESRQVDGTKTKQDIERKALGARNGIQWVSRTRLAEDSYSRAVEYYSKGDKAKALGELRWTLSIRPTYTEALRLEERVISEMEPGSSSAVERIMLNSIQKEKSGECVIK